MSDKAKPRPILFFTKRVLGDYASDQLKMRKVTLTVRSRREAYPFFQLRGTEIEIHLDRAYLYNARLTSVYQKPIRKLNDMDAECGGFLSLLDQKLALKRAGFRFKAVEDYTDTWALEFLPLK